MQMLFFASGLLRAAGWPPTCAKENGRKPRGHYRQQNACGGLAAGHTDGEGGTPWPPRLMKESPTDWPIAPPPSHSRPSLSAGQKAVIEDTLACI